jgi:hypothetical protein
MNLAEISFFRNVDKTTDSKKIQLSDSRFENSRTISPLI